MFTNRRAFLSSSFYTKVNLPERLTSQRRKDMRIHFQLERRSQNLLRNRPRSLLNWLPFAEYAEAISQMESWNPTENLLITSRIRRKNLMISARLVQPLKGFCAGISFFNHVCTLTKKTKTKPNHSVPFENSRKQSVCVRQTECIKGKENFKTSGKDSCRVESSR